MGCYGLGITRTIAAAVEQNHDEHGIRWPKALAPFEVVVIVANRDDEQVTAEGERIYLELAELGVEVLFDDRDESAGVKFADADLMGFPVQLVVGRRGVDAGTVDLKLRATGEGTKAPLDRAGRAAVDLLAGAP